MSGGLHSEYDLAFHICQFPDLLQQQVISGTVVSEVECLANDLAVLGNNDCLMAPLGNIESNNKHSAGTHLSC